MYFTGCATDLVYGDVGQAVLRVLLRLGIEIVVPHDQVCCSAPLFLSGATQESLPNIVKNLTILDRSDVDAIVVDCATCGAALKKEIPELLENMGLDTEKALRVANKVKDVSQIVSDRLNELHIQEKSSGEPLLVTYHDPCHLVRGMGVAAEPRKILSNIGGIKFVEMEGAGECCGGGGFYQFDNVDMSAGITSRKKRNVDATSAQIVATGCPGCRLTLTGNMSDEENREVLHTVQLLSGSCPTKQGEGARLASSECEFRPIFVRLQPDQRMWVGRSVKSRTGHWPLQIICVAKSERRHLRAAAYEVEFSYKEEKDAVQSTLRNGWLRGGCNHGDDSGYGHDFICGETHQNRHDRLL